jgi:hypothetical protein
MTSMTQGSEITVVVMERGADWPACIDACRRVTPDTVIIAQGDDEAPPALTRRVEARLAALAREVRPVRAAVIAMSRSGDLAAFDSRSRLARSLLRALNATAAEGTLWLCGSAAMPDSARHHLIALAGTLTSMLGSSGVGIAVRFADRARPESGDSQVRAIDPELVLRPLASAS